VAKTQYCAGRLGVMGRLVSGYSLPPTAPPTSPVSWITWGARVAVTERVCSLMSCVVRPLTAAESAVMHVISGCL